MIPSNLDISNSFVFQQINGSIPIEMIGHEFDYRNLVNSDSLQRMRDLVRHIFSEGDRKIAFIQDQDTLINVDRLRGKCAWLSGRT